MIDAAELTTDEERREALVRKLSADAIGALDLFASTSAIASASTEPSRAASRLRPLSSQRPAACTSVTLGNGSNSRP